ncbi:MAG TPA: LysR substrate-binding domain-containing protein [Steroidobacteraceae bacterium]|nr:LysR substrate-binding domain-containing protein [Steroidobacteraceae bacterium]
MNALPLDLLDTFVAVAREGNLTRAAKARHLTVSALSHRLRQLEERLGQPLLVRGPRGVAPTPAGARLLEQVGPALETIARAVRGVRARARDGLTVSLMPSMASAWLIPRLPRLLAQQPQIGINLLSTWELVDFAREDVDCALRYGAGRWPGVTAEPLFDEYLSPVASPELIKRIGRVKPSELGKAPLLDDVGGRWREWFARFGGAPPRHYVATFDDSEALHYAAVEGLGVALGRTMLARPLIEAGRLRSLSRQRLKSDWAHYLVYPARSAELPAFVEFRRWLHGEAQRYAAELA